MSSQQSRKPSPEEVELLRKEQLKGLPPFSREEVLSLEAYLRERDSQLLRRYLSLNRVHLEKLVWEARDWEHYLGIRGEMRMLRKLERLPEEIGVWKEQYSEAKEMRKEEGEPNV